MVAKESFKNRLTKAMQIRNMKPVELVEKTGISKANISCYMSGKYEAKADGLKLLADALDVDPVWLMGYEVPMKQIKYVTAEEWDDNSKYVKTTNPDGSISYGVPTKSKKNLNVNNLHQEIRALYGKNSVNLLNNYLKLNALGKQKVEETAEDCTTMLKYTEKKEDIKANG